MISELFEFAECVRAWRQDEVSRGGTGDMGGVKWRTDVFDKGDTPPFTDDEGGDSYSIAELTEGVVEAG